MAALRRTRLAAGPVKFVRYGIRKLTFLPLGDLGGN